MSPQDQHFFNEGTHQRLWKILGANVVEGGTHFAVWAPNASRVFLAGDFNSWSAAETPMYPVGTTGIWTTYVAGLAEGARYKYCVFDRRGARRPLKSDPAGFGAEHAPDTASVTRDLRNFTWRDGEWMRDRALRNHHNAPISIYEVHLGSWRRTTEGGVLTYEEAAQQLLDYVSELGFTHIEFLPLTEHPFDGSWGYQPIGLYAPTARHGTPHEFRSLVDAAHRRGLGVILDWVPAHFPSDAHGLARFDGTALYEHEDPRQGFHVDWNTLIYNYGRPEVMNFLVSNALFWFEEYHIDGLRVDAVASMIYRDYSRKEGEWEPNRFGGRENLEAIDFLKSMNSLVYSQAEGIMTLAEESTAFPGVSRPVHSGGLGFGFKWNMGWMNDTLEYLGMDPIYRKHHHHKMTFGMTYAFSENFVLPISHDEVVHGKGSMYQRAPGDEASRLANLRTYYGFMWGHPGKKLLFMGCEFAQHGECYHQQALDWVLAERSGHAGLTNWVRDLNLLYRNQPALHEGDCTPEGFAWVDVDNAEHSIYSWVRFAVANEACVVVVCNFTPVPRPAYQLGLPVAGFWREVLNSDSESYGGHSPLRSTVIESVSEACNGQPYSISVELPPLSCLFYVPDNDLA
ncbi:MAG: 1,4-alpha-glucan branching protein GlgB [Pseudomonadota bacterium]